MGNDPYDGLTIKYKQAYNISKKIKKYLDDNYKNLELKRNDNDLEFNWDINNDELLNKATIKVEQLYDQLKQKGYNWEINPEKLKLV